MDGRSINFSARRNLRFFLTKGAETDENRNEHKLLAAATRTCYTELREGRVRPSTALDELPKIYDIIEKTFETVQTEARKYDGFDDLAAGDDASEEDKETSDKAARAYAAAIVFAAMARYAELKEQRGGEGEGRGRGGKKDE